MPRDRDPWLDNVKMVLVTLVVVGHMIVLMPTTGAKSGVYDFVYYFHIPAFVLVTGYLSKSFAYTRRHLWALVTTLLLPYLVFSWLMAMFRHQVGGEALLDPIWSNPRWPMWYLAVLIIWRLATPVLRWHPVMVPVSIAVSLVGGMTNQELFDLNRAMGLLPFFVIGLHLPERWLAAARRPAARLAGLAALGVVAVMSALTDYLWSTSFLYWRTSYGELGAANGAGMLIRAGLIAVALVGIVGVLCLVPRNRSFLTAMGRWTLVVYLCHGFVVRGLGYAGYEGWLPTWLWGWPALLVTVTLAVGVALFLAWEPVARVLAWAVDPVSSVARTTRRQTAHRPG